MKYQLYRQRTFSQKFNLVFEWLRDNWKPVLKWGTALLLPCCIVEASFFNNMVGLALHGAMAQSGVGIFDPTNSMATVVGLVLSYLSALVCGFISISLFFSLIKLSFVDGVALSTLTFRQLLSAMKRNALRLVIGGVTVGLLTAIAAAVLVLLAAVSPFSLWLALPLFFCSLVFLVPFFPAYLLANDNDLVGALSRSVRYGWHCWWGFASTTIIISMLSSVIQGFTIMPFYITIMVQAIFANQDGVDSMAWESLIQYFSLLLSFYVTWLVSILILLMASVQYGHAADKIDGVSASADVERFDDATYAAGRKDEIDQF